MARNTEFRRHQLILQTERRAESHLQALSQMPNRFHRDRRYKSQTKWFPEPAELLPTWPDRFHHRSRVVRSGYQEEADARPLFPLTEPALSGARPRAGACGVPRVHSPSAPRGRETAPGFHAVM